MKPKRYFRTPLFLTGSIKYGVPVFAGFAILISGLETTQAGIFGGAPGVTPAAPQAGGPSPTAVVPPNASDFARDSARETLARTQQAVGAAKAMQDAARAAAANSNNAGPNPNNPSQNLPDVPNGVVSGGLMPAAGATAGSPQWQGAELPTEAIANGLSTVTVRQTAQQALLTWQTFNVGRDTTLYFNQTATGAAPSQSVAFNKIADPTANPTQILGQIKSEGQVYIINPNGIIFGGGSQINVHSLTASALPINDNLVNRGLLNNPDAQFLFSSLAIPAGVNGTPAFDPGLAANQKIGDVIVQAGAKINSPTNAAKVGGRVMLVGANVTNNGTITTPDGQTILASGLQVGIEAHATSDPSLRGLDVYVGAVTDPASTLSPYAGTTTNNGIIEAARGAISLSGKAVVQSGILDSTTSVALNGRIDIQASYNAAPNRGTNAGPGKYFLYQDTGSVTMGDGSLIRILPETGSDETTIGKELALRSQINVTGKTIRFGEDSVLLAPSALVNISAGVWNYIQNASPTSTFVQSGGQVYLDENALLDVSGLRDVIVPVSQNIIEVQLRGAELANSPLQRLGLLRGATVYIDIRDAGIYQQEQWIGTPLADLSGFVNLIQKPVEQFMVAGGTVNIQAGGSVVMQGGSSIDVSGGSIHYEAGTVRTTQLRTNGRIVDIRDARPDEVYDAILNGTTTITHNPWGVSEVYNTPLAPVATRFEEASTTGGAGGSLNITSASMALDGRLIGKTVQSDRDRAVPTAASSLKLAFTSQDRTYTSLPVHSPTPPDVIFQNGAVSIQPDIPFAVDAGGNPLALPVDRTETVYLSTGLLTDSGFGILTIDNSDGNIIVPENVSLAGGPKSSITFKGANITIDGSVTTAGGSISLSTYNLSQDVVNAVRNSTSPSLPPAAAGRGIFTLGEHGVISTAGLIVDNRLQSPTADSTLAVVNGGTVKIDSYSSVLSTGGLIDVSGGVVASSRGAITYGAAGSISLTAGRDLNIPSLLGGTLQLGSTLHGYSGSKSGSLSITAGAIQVGGGSSNPLVTVIDESFFNQGGFGSFSLAGIGLPTGTPNQYTPGLVVTSGTHIRPMVETLLANAPNGGELTLSRITREEGNRPAASLTFGATGARALDNTISVRGDLLMQVGASIETDAKGSVTFQGQTTTILGSITTPGGSITIKGDNAYPSSDPNPASALPTTHLGATASLSTAGQTVLVESALGLRQGEVLKGGSITISGNIIAEEGAVLDVSGTRGVLDLPPAYLSLDPAAVAAAGNLQYVPVTLETDAGTITMTGGQMLYSDATLVGKAGGVSAAGGTLSVSSGAFHPTGVAWNSAEANLVVRQSGNWLQGAQGAGIRAAGPAGPLAGMGGFSVDSLDGGGFDSLALNGNVRFEGDVSITMPGSLRVASGGVIYATGNVDLTAKSVALGQSFRPPSLPADQITRFTSTDATGFTSTTPYTFAPTSGTGRLSVHADLIDIGDLSLQGLGNTSFIATNGDIRGNGTLSAAGNLLFRAGQIYPTTAGHFSIFAYNGSSVTIQGGSQRSLPYSAGGTLSIYASTISQDGTLRAPIGTINLGWDGSGTAPVDAIAGTTLSRPVTTSLSLGSESVTAVSAIDPITGKGVILPYGISLDGKTWIDPAGNDITVSGVPSKAVNLSAGSVTSEAGSQIDIRGGGDLYAYRWISGNGGRNNIIASSSSFAVIPGYGFDYAPYAPFNGSTAATNLNGQTGYVNSGLKVGDQVTLAGSNGLPAGTYTLLPAAYALLPGAYLVTPQGGTPSGALSRPDGSSLVSGYRSNDLSNSGVGQTLVSQFEIASAAIVRQRAEYEDFLANTVLRDAAIAKEFAVPRLPIDSGYLSFSATTGMTLGGGVISASPAKGRGSVIDINSPVDIFINSTGTGGPAGSLTLSSALLNSFGAESLLVGGLRRFSQDGTHVSTNTGNLTLDNAGSPLTGTDIILLAKKTLTLEEGASIVTTSGTQALDTLLIGDAASSGSGDGALVRVSGNDSGSVIRRGVSSSAVPMLDIRADALLSGGSITLDSTSGTFLDPSVDLLAGSVALSSGRISIDLDHQGPGPSGGLILSGEALESLQERARKLSLRSYSTLDVYGTGQVGSPAYEQLTLQARSIRGFDATGGTTTFTAKNLVIENSSHTEALPLGSPPSGGQLVFDAEQITLGTNPLTVDQYATVLLQAGKRLITSGTGSFTTSGNLSIITPLITGAAASNHTIAAAGTLSVTRPAGSSPSADIGGLGAVLKLQGSSVEVNSDILLPSGSLTLSATSGNVTIGNLAAARIDVGGTSKQFVDVVRYTDGGTITLESANGSVAVAGAATLSVAAAGTHGDAGNIVVKAANGQLDLGGTINGSAGAAGEQGGFSLDVGTIAGGSLQSLDASLNAGNFTGLRDYRIRNGNIIVAGYAKASDYRVSADHGSITVTGTIDASGVTGGNIQLQTNGSLTLDSGSILTVAGQKFTSAGKGGKITLEAGAHRNGVIDRSSMLDIRGANGAVPAASLDLSVAENNASSARYGRFTGQLHLRAPRNASNSDLQIGTIGGNITGASSILVEGYKIYDISTGGVITTAVQNSIKSDAEAYLGAAGAPESANHAAMIARLKGGRTDLDLILAAGAEITSTGNITLGTTTSTSTSDWNLESFRFGPRGAAGVLTMRAGGDLVFYNTLSDGFAAVPANAASGNSAMWLAPLMAYNPLLPANAQSWSYRLTAGADLSAASSDDVLPESSLQPDRGSLLLGKNYGNVRIVQGTSGATATAIAGRFQVIRTGSGDITVNTGRNAYLLNQFSTIYTAGTQVQNPTSLFTAGDFTLPVLSTVTPTLSGALLGNLQQDYPAQYSMAGGNISITAAGDIARMTRTVATGTGGTLIADSSHQLPNNWLYRRGYVDPVTGEFGIGGVDAAGSSLTDPSASTTWWIDFSNFFQGIGTLGGGDIVLNAGRDVQNIDAVAPTNARMASGRPDQAKMIELGGGDVTVTAGRNIDGGVYYVERGAGKLEAGASITTNATRSPSQGLVASLTNPTLLDSNTWLPTTLFVGKGGFDVQAGGDLLLGPVANPFLLPQGIGNKFWYKTYFSTYGADSYVNATSLGGSVTHRTEVTLPTTTGTRPLLQTWLETQQLFTSTSVSNFQPWLRLSETSVTPFATLAGLMPPNLTSTSFSSDIRLQGNLVLFPSSSGQIELFAANSIQALMPTGLSNRLTSTGDLVQAWKSATINLSDADPLTIPGITSPYAYQSVVGLGFANLRTTSTGRGVGFLDFLDKKFAETGSSSGVLQDKVALHAQGLLHRGDNNPARLFALGGDISGLTLFSPKETRIIAGNDITDVAFYLQNLSVSDNSIVSAGRDLIPSNSSTALRIQSLLAGNFPQLNEGPLAGDIQISGPGTLQVLAGRNIDLGIGASNSDGTGVGITSTGNVRNPALPVGGADLILGAGIGPALDLVASQLDFNRFIDAFVNTPAGAVYLKKIAPGVDFPALTESEQAQLALEVFYLVLRNAGRDYNDPDSPDFRKYTNGFAAIASLFGEGPWEGEILTQGRDIRTRSGGDISIFAPGGGLTLANTTIGNPLTPPGIVTESGGKISIFTHGSVDIGIGRIFTLRGGDATIWSSTGDIAAGSSSRTIAAAPPTRVIVNTQSATVETDLAGLATGGGIGVLATVEGVAPGDVDLIAPAGSIDAGDAGIRVSGNINLAGVAIVNAANISAAGTSTGAPAAAVSISTVTTAPPPSNTSTDTTNPGATAGDKQNQGMAPEINAEESIISAEVIGYGGGSDEEDEEEKRRKRKAADQQEEQKEGMKEPVPAAPESAPAPQ